MTADHSAWPALGADHIWCETGAGGAGAAPLRPALFLDRDGVLVEEVGYLHRVEDVAPLAGASALVARANGLGAPVVMVTNQAGIGRGYYGWAAFARVNACIVDGLARDGARIDAVLACPFHRDGHGPYRHADHPMRKPNPGMLLRAGERLGIDLARSLMVGDKACDLRAARAAGLRHGFFVLTGHGAAQRAEAMALDDASFQVTVIDSLAAPALRQALEAQFQSTQQ